MTQAEDNKELIKNFWATLGRRDFAAVAAFFAPDGHYTDVPAPEEGARGPAAIEARLRLGLEPLERYVLNDGPMTAEGDMVITEHTEDWYWSSGEHVTLPFVSVHEIRDGLVIRWWDYWDLGTLMNAAPASWVEHIMVGYQ
ncbi:MAG: nuclear transport factor 2 family protein [Acidimicrobiia bacterium]|nr:nuclear transport factor 2 family protein [Acidimicrobiia bacterium]